MASSENAGDVMLSKVCTPVMRANSVGPGLAVERRGIGIGVAVGARINLDLLAVGVDDRAILRLIVEALDRIGTFVVVVFQRILLDVGDSERIAAGRVQDMLVRQRQPGPLPVVADPAAIDSS